MGKVIDKQQVVKSPSSSVDLIGDLQYLEVDISSAEILAWHTTPISLFSAASAGTYNDVIECVFEFYPGATSYTMGAAIKINIIDDYGSTSTGGIRADILSVALGDDAYTKVSLPSPAISGVVDIVMGYAYGGTSWSTQLDAAVTLGDGTAKFKIWYVNRQFG
jgi:hypothetical protein